MPLKCGPVDRLRPEAICVYVWQPMNADTDNNTIYEALHLPGLWCWCYLLMKCARSHLQAESFHMTSKKLLLQEMHVQACTRPSEHDHCHAWDLTQASIKDLYKRWFESHCHPEVMGCLSSFEPWHGLSVSLIIRSILWCGLELLWLGLELTGVTVLTTCNLT